MNNENKVKKIRPIECRTSFIPLLGSTWPSTRSLRLSILLDSIIAPDQFQHVNRVHSRSIFGRLQVSFLFLRLVCLSFSTTRYFLKEDVILSRIPVQYPVYRFIPDLIRSVNHRILYGEPNINISSRSKHRQLI